MQVARNKRATDSTGSRRRARIVTTTIASVVALGAGTGMALATTNQFGYDQVGKPGKHGLLVSANQYLNPYGERLTINNGKIMSSVVSPDGKYMAASVADGGVALLIIDLSTYQVKQVIGKNKAADLQIAGNDVGQEGPIYSPDGSQLWLGQLGGYTKFSVKDDGTLASPSFVPIAADGTKKALASGATFSSDGTTMYAAANGQNKVVAIDTATGGITKTWDTGIAPRAVVRVGSKLYVSNEGGRKAAAGDTTINSYGTDVPANPVTGASTNGTVSVIDTAKPAAKVKSISVGLHPTAIHAADGALFVTNTFDDTVSVVDTRKNTVVQTIATRPWEDAAVGYAPNAVTLTNDGHLLVTLGRANAVAVYKYSSPQEPVSYVGLLPTDYYPSEIVAKGKDILVSNTRGIDARRPTTAAGQATHNTTSSLTRFTLPSDAVIKKQTKKVFAQNGWTKNSLQKSKGNKKNVQPVAVPKKLGDPSTIKHVFLIVKENRTYDQVFGDDGRGNGNATLAQFGQKVTPNQHALVKQFGLYDNTYDIGTNSAEGHNWLMQSDNPEYTESSAGEYTRSYDTEDDALGHQRSGFLWSGAQAAGKSVRNFGEFQQFLTKPAGASWQNLYCDTKKMAAGADTAYPMVSTSPIPSLNDVSVKGFPKFDTDVPDIYRAQIWKKDFAKNGAANLNMFWLSSDHTGGAPGGAAQVADNDLAVGQIVDTISHSPIWKDSAIFVVEDDSQAGLDHIDGHRAPIQIISPWAQHGVVDSRFYSQITMIRTIEQILGVTPMNQKDTAASPMFGAFTNTPDNTPFNAVPNQTSLTEGLKTQPTCGPDVPAGTTAAAVKASSTVPADKAALAGAWTTWLAGQRTTGSNAVPDFASPVLMDHYTWYNAHQWKTPYPGEKTFFTPDKVPGGFIPSNESDG